ncbi:TPA: hypothetical protein DCE37_08935 [Candidatus Latescibacteria bacterium]|nr:hypothetical protein [Candidatus Latescibacterota bacterium]
MGEAVDRLSEQLAFLEEIDKVKLILRQTSVADNSRRENDAEHSWHLATMALILEEHAAEPVDLMRVIKMVLIHDLVEIDAGDTFAYDEVGAQGQADRERKAAERIFAILPVDQRAEVDALWTEFEAKETAESKYAASLDRFQPMLLNFLSEGSAWKRHGIRKSQVIARNRHIADGSTALWEYAQKMIDRAVDRGYLLPD